MDNWTSSQSILDPTKLASQPIGLGPETYRITCTDHFQAFL